MRRREFLQVALAGADLAARKPNIVLILADDLGYGDVGCYNPESKIPTPNLDRLAKQSLRLTDAHSPSAVCSPTRYAILTGRYSWRSRMKFGVWPTNSPYLIEQNRTTMPMLLRQQGYRTAVIGKWHLGLTNGGKWDLNGLLEPGPLAAGFDMSFVLPSVFSEDPYCFLENGRLVGKMKPDPETRHFYQRDTLIRVAEGWKDDELGPTITAKAVSFLEAQTKEKPFFLYFPASAPHDPNIPVSFLRGKSQAGLRGDCVAEFDWTVGRILDALDRTGQAENTLVIVTSDNGPRPSGEDGETFGHASAGKLRGFKGDLWEGGHRVPFLARWPGKIQPGVSEKLFGLGDLMASFVAACGAALPDSAGEDSVNQLPMLTGGKSTKAFEIHHSGSGYFAIRQGPWKLIPLMGTVGSRVAFLTDKPNSMVEASKERLRKPGSPLGELYNLDDDPAERNNLYDRLPDRVYDMLMLLEQCRRLDRTNNIPTSTAR